MASSFPARAYPRASAAADTAAADELPFTARLGELPEAGASVASTLDTVSFVWPGWARTARLAGAYFFPAEETAVVAARLDRLAAEGVSVLIADSPFGGQYRVWVDDDLFAATRALIARVVEMAHARGLKVVLYHSGLELLAAPGQPPAAAHLAWAQRGRDGRPVLFNDVENHDLHWLRPGVWDFWVHPCGGEGTFQALALQRVCAMVATGIDGLWVDEAYLQASVGRHHGLWPSHDPCSIAAFHAATGLATPTCEDWDDPIFRRWVVWRHTQMVDYLRAEVAAARAVNPQIVVVNENSCVDTARATYVATDPASLHGVPDMTTAHEIETIADRMDLGETGMQGATCDDWLALRTMVAFARAADRGKPSWILTYGYAPRDSAQLAGFTVAEGANFYETRGPQMADSVGSAFRTALFGWIATHAADLYATDSAAEVGLLYSPRNRDLVDTLSGQPYVTAGARHFAAYRKAARTLYRAHVPFDVVLDTDTAHFNHYRVLVAPHLDLMSDGTAAALRAFTGTLITVGAAGRCDEWGNLRPRSALYGCRRVRLAHATAALGTHADTGLFTAAAPASVQFGLRCAPDGYRLIVVNSAPTPAPACAITVRVGARPHAWTARLVVLGAAEVELAATVDALNGKVRVDLPPALDTLALLKLQRTGVT